MVLIKKIFLIMALISTALIPIIVIPMIVVAILEFSGVQYESTTAFIFFFLTWFIINFFVEDILKAKIPRKYIVGTRTVGYLLSLFIVDIVFTQVSIPLQGYFLSTSALVLLEGLVDKFCD